MRDPEDGSVRFVVSDMRSSVHGFGRLDPLSKELNSVPGKTPEVLVHYHVNCMEDKDQLLTEVACIPGCSTIADRRYPTMVSPRIRVGCVVQNMRLVESVLELCHMYTVLQEWF